MRKIILTCAIALFLAPHAKAQVTISVSESSQADWILGTIDSLSTTSDTLTLEPVQSFRFQFTNCMQLGLSGPSQVMCDGDYTGTDLAGQVTVLAGKQYWQVPQTGLYRVTASGAGHNADPFLRGAVVKAYMELTQGTGLVVLAGQEGDSPRGGSGGSFVTLTDTTPVIIAGGAAGMRSYSDSSNLGSTATSGQGVSSSNCSTPGGVAGQGGQATGGGGCSGAGGGLLGDGQGCGGGLAFINGATGGSASYDGGFGGGGGVNAASSPGGGGGYSGGSVQYTGGGSSCAGGGGSFLMSTALGVATSDGHYDNSPLFNGDSIFNLGYYHIGQGSVRAELDEFVSSGMRVSPVHDVSTPASTLNTSMISWDADTFAGTSLLVETRFSTDGGAMWSSWSPAANYSPVPGLLTGMPMDSARVQTRVTMSSQAQYVSPAVYWLNLLVLNDTMATGLAAHDNDSPWLTVYPNPSGSSLTVAYQLKQKADVSLRIFSSVGETVWQVSRNAERPGYRQVHIPHDELSVAPGIYWLELVSHGRSARKKLVRF